MDSSTLSHLSVDFCITGVKLRQAEVGLVDTDFIVGQDRVDDIKVSPTPQSNFYWFYNTRSQNLIKQFVLQQREQVDYLCQVTLIKKEDKFSPRLRFFIRHHDKPKAAVYTKAPANETTVRLKASVSLNECHENFWALMSYLKHMQDLDVPDESFSLVKKTEHELLAAFSERTRTPQEHQASLTGT